MTKIDFYVENKVEKIDATSNDKLDKAISKVVKQVSSMQAQLHAVLVACVTHANLHKDASKLTYLMQNLSDSVNKKNGIDIWIKKYTSLSYGKNKLGQAMYLDKDKKYTFILEGEQIPFYDMPETKKANKPLTDMLLIAALKGLIAKGSKEGTELTDKGLALIDTLASVFQTFAPQVTNTDKVTKADGEVPFAA